MPIAQNPETGDVLFLDGDQWKPAQRAINPKTREMMAFDGKGWVHVDDAAARGVAQQIQKGQTVTGTAPVKDDLAYRANVLPLGKTQEGNIVPAVPGAITGAVDAARNLINAGTAGPPGSREVTQAAIGPAAQTAMAFAPASPAAAEAGAIVKNLVGGKAPAQLTTDELHALGSGKYKTAEQAGAAIEPDAYVQMVSDIAKQVKKEGFDKDIQPKAAAALRRLYSEAQSRMPRKDPMEALTGVKQAKATPVTLSDFDIIRQVAQGAAKAPDSNERRIGGIIKGAMDDFLSNPSEKQFVGGDSKGAAKALSEARPIWARYAKSSEIDQIFENANIKEGGYSAAGYEKALQNEFKRLATNPNRMRKFSGDEQAAIKEAATSGKFQSGLVKLGKFSPNAGFFAGLVSGEILLQSAANPKLLAIPAAGAIARYAATKLRERSAENVRRVVSGGKEAAEFYKNRTAARKGAVSDIARKAQRPALFGGSSGLVPRITIPLDPNNL